MDYTQTFIKIDAIARQSTDKSTKDNVEQSVVDKNEDTVDINSEDIQRLIKKIPKPGAKTRGN